MVRRHRRPVPWRQPTEILTVSEWTRRTLIESAGLPSERIEVTHLGVDHARFRPFEPATTLYERYRLDPGTPVPSLRRQRGASQKSGHHLACASSHPPRRAGSHFARGRAQAPAVADALRCSDWRTNSRNPRCGPLSSTLCRSPTSRGLYQPRRRRPRSLLIRRLRSAGA